MLRSFALLHHSPTAAGTFATTYKGTYGGQSVAAKVLTAVASQEQGTARAAAESEAAFVAERCFFKEAQLLRKCNHK